MAALLRLLVLVCALFAPASAFVAPSMPLSSRSAVAPAAVTMGCRQNLKKEKRVRNRINAFRFKKGGFVRRRFGPDYAAEQAKADADNQFYSMVFTYTAEAAALAEEEAKKEAKEGAKA